MPAGTNADERTASVGGKRSRTSALPSRLLAQGRRDSVDGRFGL